MNLGSTEKTTEEFYTAESGTKTDNLFVALKAKGVVEGDPTKYTIKGDDTTPASSVKLFLKGTSVSSLTSFEGLRAAAGNITPQQVDNYKNIDSQLTKLNDMVAKAGIEFSKDDLEAFKELLQKQRIQNLLGILLRTNYCTLYIKKTLLLSIISLVVRKRIPLLLLALVLKRVKGLKRSWKKRAIS